MGDETRPLVRGARGWVEPPQARHFSAPTPKPEQIENRAHLYAVVRECMTRAGVLSASYKFKVLALDRRGTRFLVMVDVAREAGGDSARLSEIEALMAQTCKARHGIHVEAVYWRMHDHVAVGVPQRSVVSNKLAPSFASAPQARAERPSQSQHDRVADEEVIAFKRALAGGVSARVPTVQPPAARANRVTDAEPSEDGGHRGRDSAPAAWGSTQYGDLQ